MKNADLFKDTFGTYATEIWSMPENDFLKWLNEDAKPKTGHWSHDGSHWKNRFICSKCGYKLFDEPTNYCPNCGAKMIEPQESEE